ncbi:menaquinone-dependent protoporphyrinogen IX dehydrogenase [Mongoliitalea lutea]|uniref:Protoporphyrinogen IX dehydrogenase [quinone] n=1 Tax=Mongoliitalea lutea TaxID=849756 RepID=A0A8J3CZS7_9BACT|nr:menaquinone-dependent protoporphyrinogen IX dehydrogenase [Mongoliitalea lutea]GHB42822.1 protoporphyrinogen oxidase [Mongoliitalea lutea]
MPPQTIIIYSSVDGQTKKICEYVQSLLSEFKEEVKLLSIEDFIQEELSLDVFSKIILASSIRYGKHNQEITALIHQEHQILQTKTAAFISVNLVARKKEKSSYNTNPYVIKFLQTIPWKPTVTAVFAGQLNYKIYSFWDKLLIRLIMKLTKGPTDPNTDIEYTDWEAVDAFAKKWHSLK